jgi:hypothetical protein
MTRTTCSFLLCVAFCCPGPAGLARPLDTDDTGTVARGQWELEGGFDFLRADGAGAWALTPVLAYGVNDRLQVDFGCDYLVELGEAGDPRCPQPEAVVAVQAALVEFGRRPPEFRAEG